MKIVCDDKIPFLRGVFGPWAETVYLKGAAISARDVRDADALIVRTRTRCDASLLQGSRVRIVATATIGYDHIDTAWCERHGIRWVNAPGCNASSVKHYLASVLCTLSERLSFDLRRAVVGVVGVGHVGRKVAAAAEALGCRVLCNDPPRSRTEPDLPAGLFVPLDELLRRCNILTLHVPLSDEGPDATRHLFDEERLRQWLGRPSFAPLSEACPAVLVNASRGPVVDNGALKRAVGRYRLGAVLDTWENEPDIDRDLLRQCLIATPHIAGYSADGKANGTQRCVQAVAAELGLPLAEWKPADIPRLQPELLTIPATCDTTDQVLKHCILQTYAVAEDDMRLRAAPEAFEKLRGNYPIRRDIESYSVSLSVEDAASARALRQLGFRNA